MQCDAPQKTIDYAPLCDPCQKPQADFLQPALLAAPPVHPLHHRLHHDEGPTWKRFVSGCASLLPQFRALAQRDHRWRLQFRLCVQARLFHDELVARSAMSRSELWMARALISALRGEEDDLQGRNDFLLALRIPARRAPKTPYARTTWHGPCRAVCFHQLGFAAPVWVRLEKV